ncbi:MAG: alpha/beta hydrolase family protein, partial [Patescibacteria group bacterium]
MAREPNDEFWVHKNLLRELIGAIAIVAIGLKKRREYIELQKKFLTDKPKKDGILIFEGFSAPQFPYFSLSVDLSKKLHIPSRVADFGKFNLHSYAEMMQLADIGFLDMLSCFRLQRVHLIGHSLGGPVVLWLLGKHPESVGKVFCVASPSNPPFAETAWIPLQALISLVVAKFSFQKALLAEIVVSAQPYADRITTISTANDKILSQVATHFPDNRATNIVYYFDSQKRKETSSFQRTREN